MALVHGGAVEARELESAVRLGFTPVRFASLCNAVAWAHAGGKCTSLPSFTERVNVADKGIDAEWQTELTDVSQDSAMLGPGWNVYQYKLRDVDARGRERTFSDLKAGLKGAVKKLAVETQRHPNRYVVFTNLDLTHFTGGQKGELKNNILEGYDRHDEVRVEIVGAAELATLLNSLPHLRYAFFAPAFLPVGEAWDQHITVKRFGAGVALVGRDEEMANLQSFLEDPEARVLVVSGPHDVGKTRLALEATITTRPLDTVVALDSNSLGAVDLLRMRPPGVEVIVLVEDPSPEKAESLVHQALAESGVKLLVTLPTAEDEPTPGYGRDPRVHTVRLGGLSEEKSRELLSATGADLDYAVESWVIERASGNPGILLAAAEAGSELRTGPASFGERVGRLFERRVRRELGDDAIKSLKALSVLTQIGIERSAAWELDVCCQVHDHNSLIRPWGRPSIRLM